MTSSSQDSSHDDDDWERRTVHTYTPQSHENFLRQLPKITVGKDDLDALKAENKELRYKLNKALEELENKQIAVNELRNKKKKANNDKQSNSPQESCSVENETLDYDYDLFSDLDDDQDSELCTLSNHFNEVIRRHHDLMQKKDIKIKELEDALNGSRSCPSTSPTIAETQQPLDFNHPAIDDQRFRRTEAAVKVFKNDLDLLKSQINNFPLSEQRYTPTTDRDKAVVKELERRQNFGIIAEIEKMGRYFMERLELEERLDKLHWQIEIERYRKHKDKEGDNFDPKCSYHQEFELLQMTRHNLLKELKYLKSSTSFNNISKSLINQEGYGSNQDKPLKSLFFSYGYGMGYDRDSTESADK